MRTAKPFDSSHLLISFLQSQFQLLAGHALAIESDAGLLGLSHHAQLLLVDLFPHVGHRVQFHARLFQLQLELVAVDL